MLQGRWWRGVIFAVTFLGLIADASGIALIGGAPRDKSHGNGQ
jgi:hypothetical protein